MVSVAHPVAIFETRRVDLIDGGALPPLAIVRLGNEVTRQLTGSDGHDVKEWVSLYGWGNRSC